MTERGEDRAVTIYDIAREAGVSASTVSRVINDKPGVAKEKRERVQALLSKYQYVPNEAARGLVTSSSRMIGILLADIRQEHHIAGAYYIASELSGRGYSSLVMNAGSTEAERVAGIQMLEQRSVEAAVLMGSIFQTETIREAIARCLPQVPVFMLNGFLDLPNVYGVLSDDRDGVAACVRLLQAKGRRRIALLVDAPTPSSRLKAQGYLDAVAGAQEPIVERGVPGDHRGGVEAMRHVLAAHPDVDGVIGSLDIIACGAMRALQDAGREVPRDVSVIGVDNTRFAEVCRPALTSLDTMALDLGVTIAHKLVDCLEGRGTNRRTMLFTAIVEREST